MRAPSRRCTLAAWQQSVTAGQMNARTVVSSMRLGSVLSRRLCAIAVGRYRRAYGRPSRLESLELNVRVLRIFNEPSRFYAVEWSLGSSAISGTGLLGGLRTMRERGPPASSSGRDTARERARGRWIGGSLRAGRLGLSRARRWRENEMADVRQEAVSCED